MTPIYLLFFGHSCELCQEVIDFTGKPPEVFSSDVLRTTRMAVLRDRGQFIFHPVDVVLDAKASVA